MLSGLIPIGMLALVEVSEASMVPAMGKYGVLYSMLTVLLLMVWLAGSLVITLVRSNWWPFGICFSLGVVVIVGSICHRPSDAGWSERFARERHQYEDTRDRLMSGSKVEGGHFRYEKEGRVGVVIEMGCTGTDNCIGFAWSTDGKPPPEAAYYQIVEATPMGDGWYLVKTT